LLVVDVLVLLEPVVVVDAAGGWVLGDSAGLFVEESAASFLAVAEAGGVWAGLDVTAKCHIPNPAPTTRTIMTRTSGFLIKGSTFANHLVCTTPDPPDTIPEVDDSEFCFG
jgi:hypothetical protein